MNEFLSNGHISLICSPISFPNSIVLEPVEMDDSSRRDFTTPIPSTFHFSPNFGENNENEQIGSIKADKSNKPALKHFMLPTMSAASKTAIGPRKKILGERNEAFTFTDSHHQKSQILDSRISPIVSGRSIRSPCHSVYDTDKPVNIDADPVLKKPYDPLTNYISPRPRFLRYNPNRKRKIFLNGENETTEITDGVGVVSTNSSYESQKDVVEESTSEEVYVKEEMEKSEGIRHDGDADDENEEEEEETEEFEEGKCWSLKGFMNLLLVLGSLFLFTTFIISINSPSPSRIQEGSWEFGDGFFNQSDIIEVVGRKEYFRTEFEVMSGKGDESRFSLLDVTQKDMDDEFVELGISEDNGNDWGVLESTAGLSEGVDVQNKQLEDHSNDEVEVNEDDFSDEVELQNEHLEDDSSDEVEVFDPFLPTSSVKFRANESVIDQEMKKIQEGSEELQGTEAAENIASLQEDSTSGNEATTILNSENEKLKSEEEIRFPLLLVVLALSFTIVAALGLMYHYSRQTNSGTVDNFRIQESNNYKQDDMPTKMQLDAEHLEAPKIQNSNIIFALEEQQLKKVESFGSPSTPVHLQKVASEQFNRHTNAPIVELLGELVIGEEASSSFRNTKLRREVIDPEEKNSNSVAPTTQMTMSRSKNPSVQKDSSQLELSTADSTSYGPFITEKKKSFVMKEENKGGEESIATVTPVRRSSRIRNRAMSP